MGHSARRRFNLTPMRLAAAVAAAAISASASAEVEFHVVDWTLPATFDGLFINFPERTTGTSAGSVLGWDLNIYSRSATSASSRISWNLPSANSGCVVVTLPSGNEEVGNLPPGTLVGPSSTFGADSSRLITNNGGWQSEAQNYFGFRFVALDGPVRYGWARMAIGADMTTKTINQIAWETSAATPIRVGDSGAPYDPCDAINPTLSTGLNDVRMNVRALDLATDCGIIHKANYFKYSVPVDGEYTFDTCFSKADTTMVVLDACKGGNSLGCNDNGCWLSSEVTLTLTGGSAVYVAIGGSNEESEIPDTLYVGVYAPPVTACVQAADLVYGDNAFDTAKSGNGPLRVQGSMFGDSVAIMNHPVWFRFSPPVTGPYGFETCYSTGDTLLAIGEDCPEVGSTFGPIAFNDDAPCSQADSNRSYIDATNNGAKGPNAGFPLTKDLVAGRVYYLCVGTFKSKDQVIGSLHVIGPKYNTCPADLNGDRVVDGFDLAQLLASWGACP
jgi:hypothetical protein